MRQVRICIYGGTDLDDTAHAFISALSYQILNSMAAVIVTGGFRLDDNNPNAISTDMAALEGAVSYANDTGTELKDCYEAWIPEPTLDSRSDNKEAERMTEQDGVTLRVMKGRTPLGRRLAMVAGVDFIVTISGKVHTEVVIEQSLELGLPVLPIPEAGGDSKDAIEKHGDRIAAAFEPGALEQCLDVVKQSIAADPNTAARAVVELIGKAKLGRCLILLPYDEEHNATYPLIEKAVARHMVPFGEFKVKVCFKPAIRWRSRGGRVPTPRGYPASPPENLLFVVWKRHSASRPQKEKISWRDYVPPNLPER